MTAEAQFRPRGQARQSRDLSPPGRRWLPLLGLLCGQLLWCGGAAAQSLSDSLVHAYLTNPTLSAARARLRAVNERVPQALADWRPFVAGSSTFGAAQREIQDPRSDSEGRTGLDAEVSVIQPLYRGGRTVAATARAKFEVQAERASLVTTEQIVLLDATTAFLDVWRDQSIVKLQLKNEQVLERQLEASRDRFEVGEVTLTDVAQSESRLARATADRIEAEGDLTASRAVFQRVVGLAPGTLAQPDPAEGLPQSLDELMQRALRDDPRVVQADFTERAAQKSIREVEGEFLPEVRLRGTAEHEEDRFVDDSKSQEYSIFAEVTIPLYQQGAVSSRTREAKQIASQRRLEIDEAIRQTTSDSIDSWENLQTARAQIKSFEAEVRATDIALEGVREENAVGARTILDILDAEQEFLDAQVNLVIATRDELVARYQVLAVLGRLTAADLGLAVDIYDEEQDYKAVKDKWFGTDAPGTDAPKSD